MKERKNKTRKQHTDGGVGEVTNERATAAARAHARLRRQSVYFGTRGGGLSFTSESACAGIR